MTDPHDRTALSDTQAADTADTQVDEAYCSACNESYGVERDVCPKDGARLIKLKATRDVLIGRVFDGRYEVLSALGHGGMGTVYRAHQISVDREVAIKVIHPKLASDRTAVKRFLREARLASRLSQPNIVNVYDFGQTDDGILYLVMELLRGHTLAHDLEPMRPLPLRRVLAIAQQLCDALEVAHAHGIVHRDLKPSNVVVLDDPPGRDLIKVLDFGLAKSLVTDTSSLITASSALLGTPLYMPPEQINGAASDQRADLYAFGCILHQLFTGRPPFVRENVNMVLAAHLTEPPPPLPASVPAPLARLILDMMAKDPDERPASAARVRAVLAGEGAPDDTVPIPGGFAHADAHPPTTPIALAVTDAAGARPALAVPVAPRRSRARVAWIAVPMLALAAVGGVLIAQRGRSPAAAAVVDAGTSAAVVVDAGTPAVVDAVTPAAVVVDAATPAAVAADAALADAARPSHPGPVHAVEHPRVPHPDAGVVAPPAHPIDAAMPSIDYTR